MNEVWKDIKGYEGMYQCSSLGNIRSLDRIVICKNGRIDHKIGTTMKLRQNKNGYMQIGLTKHNVRKMTYVHRLIAETFIENPDNKSQINHKDGDKLNNSVENLEWVTASENLKHSYENLNRTINSGKHRKIKGYDEDGELIFMCPSLEKCAKWIGLSPTQTRRLIENQKRTKEGVLLVG